MSGGRLVVAGDALLDRDVDGHVERLSPEAPVPVLEEHARRARPGGAALAAALATADGRPVTLVTALARDEAGLELRALLDGAGVEVIDLGLEGPTPEKIRLRAEARLLLRLDRGGRRAGRIEGREPGRVDAALAGAAAVLVADYGRGLAAEPALRASLAALGTVPVVWDPHPRGPAPVPGAALATPNREEAAGFVPEIEGDGLGAATDRGRMLAARWSAAAVAVTLGANGALLVVGEDADVVPAPPVVGGDACGAGDRFASAAASALGAGAGVAEAVAVAVAAASGFVSAGGAGSFGIVEPQALVATSPADAAAVAARTRARGGTVVATGGCFDLLHAGHVATLEAARSLGDCLVVLLNSDASVRRLKGPERPLVPEADRAAVLRALSCVDAVAIFTEATPEAALERLRPDIFAKGGDYTLADLPEAALLAGWGGRAVILPYMEGRSTTRLLEEAALRGAA